MEKMMKTGRTYGRTTGYAILEGKAVRVRLGIGGASYPDGTQGLYVYPFGGTEDQALLVPAHLTRRTKAEAAALLGVTQ